MGAHEDAVCCGTEVSVTHALAFFSEQPNAQKRSAAREALSQAHTRRSVAARLPRSAESFTCGEDRWQCSPAVGGRGRVPCARKFGSRMARRKEGAAAARLAARARGGAREALLVHVAADDHVRARADRVLGVRREGRVQIAPQPPAALQAVRAHDGGQRILDRDRGAAELKNAQFRTALDLAVLHNHVQVAEVLRRAT